MPDALPDLAVIILTRNEEKHLGESLRSAFRLTDHVVVFDSESTDCTRRIAAEHGATFHSHPFTGFASQRNRALSVVDTEWVLFLDADERLPDPLITEIQSVLTENTDVISGYWIARRNQIFGREMHGGGWWPDYQLRLLRRTAAYYDPSREVHETVITAGETQHLTHPLIHLNYDTWDEFHAKQQSYAEMRSAIMTRAGIRPRRRTFIGQPTREFWRRFVSLSGYRDRLIGLRLALTMATYEYRTWRMLASQHQTQQGTPTGTRSTSRKSQSSSNTRATVPALPVITPEFDLSIIIVSYNVQSKLLACLSSIEASLSSSDLTAEVIVIDNGSNDGSPDLVRRRFPTVNVIENGKNAGYAAANNSAAKQARGRKLLFLNPDTMIEGTALDTLARYLDTHTGTGVVGPMLRYPDGTVQSSRRRFPTRRTGFIESTLVQEYMPNSRILKRYYIADRPDTEEQAVDWLVGACLMVDRQVPEAIGLFDERFFMYSEEIEWCYRVRQHGWSIMYLPGATIRHFEGASSGQNAPARQINFDTSKVILYEELFGRGTAWMLHGFLLLTYLVRIGIETVKGILGHKRSLRWQRIRMYTRVFAGRLRRKRKVVESA